MGHVESKFGLLLFVVGSGQYVHCVRTSGLVRKRSAGCVVESAFELECTYSCRFILFIRPVGPPKLVGLGRCLLR